ncbi:Oidioi.mRNA.OKI2018_I69.XSR.g16812.t1.cds [Oikopleura dioica]|uniref:Oidioi.mRNA.OKI2018_I69.XSR.g16812.t1.cds n=1 Tax=Oikopleura dioica TaxID=34765 RepID=A0ABN7SHB3_OIKDI|nr:Oidioi.mRNA.OKI2018_I69.XSR.g16812.t1.cds [Oikopleura dioica]
MTHPSCDKLCVCLSQNKKAKQTAETTIPSSQLEILGLEKTKITLGDKNFLTQLFPSSTISASDKQPLDHLKSQKNATETVLKSQFDDSNHRRMISEAESDAILFIENAKLTLHKYPLRCAKCFKAATCQTNCCEYHVFCDLCKEQAITCEDENRELLTKMHIGSYRGKVIQFVTKHWHEKYKADPSIEDPMIPHKETGTTLKEIHKSMCDEGLMFYRRSLPVVSSSKAKTEKHPIVKTEREEIE